MVLMIAGLMSTVGVYAAGFGVAPSPKTLAGAESVGVTASNTSTTTVSWRFSGTQVDAAKVTWTPVAEGSYDIIVTAGGQTGTLVVSPSGTTERVDDIVVLAVPVEASAVTTAAIVIEEN
jgi:hypothetical protein